MDGPSSITPASPRIYSVGTLRYTLGGLVVLFAWLLFSDFCFQIMELVVPNVLPLTLKDLGASAATTGLLVGTIASAASLVLNPIISMHSDRHRGPWGRRRPYLVWTVPFISLFLVMTGFSHDIGAWLHDAIGGRLGNLSRASVIIGVIGVAIVVFQAFNMFVRSVYYYLLNDVVPSSVIGRFYALFRVFDAVAGYVFFHFIFKHAESEIAREWIYISMAILFIVAFMLTCWRVKEGDYPPPEPLPEGPWWQRAVAGTRLYVTECFSVPLFLCLYTGNALYRAADVNIFNFRTLLAKDLGMNLEQASAVFEKLSLASIPFYLVFGLLSDKLHPARLVLISAIVTTAAMVGGTMVRGPVGFSVVMWVWTIAWLAYISAIIPLTLAILPRDRYGQFASANGVFYAAALMIANYAGGLFIDQVGTMPFIRDSGSQYLAIFWWGAATSFGSVACFLVLYVVWKRRQPAAQADTTS